MHVLWIIHYYHITENYNVHVAIQHYVTIFDSYLKPVHIMYVDRYILPQVESVTQTI